MSYLHKHLALVVGTCLKVCSLNYCKSTILHTWVMNTPGWPSSTLPFPSCSFPLPSSSSSTLGDSVAEDCKGEEEEEGKGAEDEGEG